MTEQLDTNSTTPASATGCVHCHAELELRSHESVQVLVCPVGHGLFLHADALQVAVHDRTLDRPESEERAAESAQRPIAIEHIEADEQEHSCPTCGAPMAKRVFAYESGVPIDVCEEHGVWLDHGELERIEAWYEAQERHKDSDATIWSGPTGRLEQIEADAERQAADDIRAIHWGPVGAFMASVSYWWARRDDR